LVLLNLLAGTAKLAGRDAGPSQKNGAHRREDGAPLAALKERGSEFPLQLPNASSDGRLGETQMSGSASQAALVGDCDDVSNLMELH
jgi:hypothetical protein